jgi:hypothetical protein
VGLVPPATDPTFGLTIVTAEQVMHLTANTVIIVLIVHVNPVGLIVCACGTKTNVMDNEWDANDVILILQKVCNI